MNTKRSAWFFLFLVCSSHVWTSLAHSVVNPTPQEGCEIDARVLLIIGDCVEKIKLNVEREHQVQDLTVKNFKLSDVNCEGLDNLKVVGCTCKCYKDFIRVFIKISIFDVLFTFLLSLNGILGGILSGLINTLVKLLQSVVNLLVKLLFLYIDVIIVLNVHSNGKCEVQDIYVYDIGSIKILNLDLGAALEDLLGGLVGDLLTAVVKILVTQELKDLIIAEFEKLKWQNSWHNCDMTMKPHPTQPPCLSCRD